MKSNVNNKIKIVKIFKMKRLSELCKLLSLYTLIVAFSGLISSCSSNDLILKAGELKITIGPDGHLTQLTDISNQKDYFPEGEPAPLMAIRVNNIFESPSRMYYDQQSNTITLNYLENDVQAEVSVEEKDTHLVLELVSMSPKDNVELVLWGPYPTSISQTIGECVGVVRNNDFAIGIQALNPKTLGGYPETEDDVMPSYNIFAGN